MRLIRVLTGFVFAGLLITAAAQKPKITIFSAQNAGTGYHQGTYAVGITSNGTIGGYYVDVNGVNHGFIRTLDDKWTVVDVPATENNVVTGTQILGMNSEREAVGTYWDGSGNMHPFLRTPQGEFKLFDIPGQLFISVAQGINDAGTTLGTYLDETGTFRGFLRTRAGQITTFDMPGAMPWAFNTVTINWFGMNQAGEITAGYWDQNVPYTWIRSPQGLVNGIPAPDGAVGLLPQGINPQGAITGLLFDQTAMRGLLRDIHGNYTVFDAPVPEGKIYGGTGPMQLNAKNTIVGNVWDVTGTNYGFIRYPNGTYKLLDLPGGGQGDYRGTLAGGINAQGWVAGTIVDNNDATKSFVMIP